MIALKPFEVAISSGVLLLLSLAFTSAPNSSLLGNPGLKHLSTFELVNVVGLVADKTGTKCLALAAKIKLWFISCSARLDPICTPSLFT